MRHVVFHQPLHHPSETCVHGLLHERGIFLHILVQVNREILDAHVGFAGEVREVQVCPLGSFENVNADGKRRTQLCDAEALARVAAAFDAPVLVDFDHSSDEGGSTEAAAWIEALRFDEAR